jgi:hypothetical protein
MARACNLSKTAWPKPWRQYCGWTRILVISATEAFNLFNAPIATI